LIISISLRQILNEPNTVTSFIKTQIHPPDKHYRRECELLRLIAEGRTMNTISEIMCIGYETVKSYRKNIMTKLQVPNTAALIKYAVERKIV